jgi:hypothetical protein
MNLKKILSEATVAGALGLAALGLGVGLANAAPPSPATSGTPWQQHGPGHGHGHGHDGDWGDWEDGGPWYGPPYWGPGISACVNATGPYGYVSGSLCI